MSIVHTKFDQSSTVLVQYVGLYNGIYLGEVAVAWVLLVVGDAGPWNLNSI